MQFMHVRLGLQGMASAAQCPAFYSEGGLRNHITHHSRRRLKNFFREVRRTLFSKRVLCALHINNKKEDQDMANCKWCGRDMTVESTKSCLGNKRVPFPGGRTEPSVPCAESECRSGRCVDCNVAVGGFHHPGCDQEKCPRCHGQIISCGCMLEAAEGGGQ